IAVSGAVGNRLDARVHQKWHQRSSLGTRDEIDLHTPRLALCHFALELGDVLLGAGDLQRPALIEAQRLARLLAECRQLLHAARGEADRKSTRLNSSHVAISYAVFCLKKKKKTNAKDDDKLE